MQYHRTWREELKGAVAQLVERVLSMHEVRVSITLSSKSEFLLLLIVLSRLMQQKASDFKIALHTITIILCYVTLCLFDFFLALWRSHAVVRTCVLSQVNMQITDARREDKIGAAHYLFNINMTMMKASPVLLLLLACGLISSCQSFVIPTSIQSRHRMEYSVFNRQR